MRGEGKGGERWPKWGGRGVEEGERGKEGRIIKMLILLVSGFPHGYMIVCSMQKLKTKAYEISLHKYSCPYLII